MGTMAAKSKAFANDSIIGNSLAFGKRSILFSASMVLPRNRRALSNNNSSARGSELLRIVNQCDLGCPRILPRFRRYDSPAIVVFLCARRIDAAHHQPQPASFCNAPRKEQEIVEDIFFCGALRHGLRFAK